MKPMHSARRRMGQRDTQLQRSRRSQSPRTALVLRSRRRRMANRADHRRRRHRHHRRRERLQRSAEWRRTSLLLLQSTRVSDYHVDRSLAQHTSTRITSSAAVWRRRSVESTAAAATTATAAGCRRVEAREHGPFGLSFLDVDLRAESSACEYEIDSNQRERERTSEAREYEESYHYSLAWS